MGVGEDLKRLGFGQRFSVRIRVRPRAKVRRPGIPVKGPVIDLGRLTAGRGRFDPNSLRLVQVAGPAGELVIQDEQLEGIERFCVPCRFEPSYEGEGVPPRFESVVSQASSWIESIYDDGPSYFGALGCVAIMPPSYLPEDEAVEALEEALGELTAIGQDAE